MTARFLLTFDCEGRWGVADHLTSRYRRELTDERLADAYRSILQLLDEYRVESTFAFVGAFAQPAREFARLRPEFEKLARVAPDYLEPALKDIDESRGEGWHGAHLVDLVMTAPIVHEVALHGVSHVPWTHMDAAAAEQEMALFNELTGPVRGSRTFVYPRNLVADSNLLAKHGFTGFRAARARRSRARALLDEFNVFEAAEQPIQNGGIIPIPAGFFLNWRSGPRALVPPTVTRLRARRLLRAAATGDAVVHYWLHPENVATAPSTLSLLRMLLREVADARETGDCEVMTQLGYCRSVSTS